MTQQRVALVVEDDVALLDLTCQLLAHLGVAAHGVGTPEAALRWLGQHTPDVVFVDLGLPGDPYALHRVLAARGLAVIVLSAHTPGDTPVSLAELHTAHLWLRKPLRVAQLKAALAAL